MHGPGGTHVQHPASRRRIGEVSGAALDQDHVVELQPLDLTNVGDVDPGGHLPFVDPILGILG